MPVSATLFYVLALQIMPCRSSNIELPPQEPPRLAQVQLPKAQVQMLQLVQVQMPQLVQVQMLQLAQVQMPQLAQVQMLELAQMQVLSRPGPLRRTCAGTAPLG